MRLRKRQVLSYVICVAVFAATMYVALRLSHPPDTYPRVRRITSGRETSVSVQTQNEILSIQVGKERYQYQLLQTDNGLAAAEIPKERK